MRLALIFALIAPPVSADVAQALQIQVLPVHQQLADQTAKLADEARKDCTAKALQPAFHEAYDAWISASHIQFGPIEVHGFSLAMGFWPDPRGTVAKTVARLSAAQDPIVEDPEAFADVSVAAQGFTALERILYTPQPDAAYACALTVAITTGLAEKSATLLASWPAFSELMQTPGAEGNEMFQSEDDAKRALYTALSTGLEFLHDQRLGRPLGTFDRPRPNRAEALLSQRSLRHIRLSLAALEQLATTLSDDELLKTSAAFSEARQRADALDDPILAGVSVPSERFRIEVLQRSVRAVQVAVIAEVGTPLGISAGFNALDGD
ncbi:MAG: imelysin family protein [Pseudomonadota bacterium]